MTKMFIQKRKILTATVSGALEMIEERTKVKDREFNLNLLLEAL